MILTVSSNSENSLLIKLREKNSRGWALLKEFKLRTLLIKLHLVQWPWMERSCGRLESTANFNRTERMKWSRGIAWEGLGLLHKGSTSYRPTPIWTCLWSFHRSHLPDEANQGTHDKDQHFHHSSWLRVDRGWWMFQTTW